MARRCSVGGVALPEHLGILIERASRESLLHGLGAVTKFASAWPLIAWLTKRDQWGEYQKFERVDPTVEVTGWDAEGHAFSFQHGILVLSEER